MRRAISHLFAQAALFLALAPVAALAQAPAPPDNPADLFVHGKWDVAYVDRDLGVVIGEAKIDEYTKKARVIFAHPGTDERFVLTSTKYERSGAKITIEFEGAHPIRFRSRGRSYPERFVVAPRENRQVRVRVGENTATTNVAPRAESDVDKLALELTIDDRHAMRARWRYRADPVTGRDRNGGGRISRFERRPDGSTWQTGGESWARPTPRIVATFVLANQMSYAGGFSDLPNYPHRFMENGNRRDKDSRTVVVVGKDLPQSVRNPAVFKSDTPHVSYSFIRYGEGVKKQAHGLDVLSQAKARFRELYPKLDFAVESLDYVIVRADLKKGVEPGFQSFTMNGADGAWHLKFGDNRARINFVRNVRPTAAGMNTKGKRTVEEEQGERRRPPGLGALTSRDTEETRDAFLPETIYVEIKTELDLKLDKIDVMVGRNGRILRLGANGPKIPARPVPGQPRIYRTDAIQLVKPTGAKDPPYRISVQPKDVLSAIVARPELVSRIPYPARADVRLTPAEKTLNVSFKNALAEANACLDDPRPVRDWNKLPHEKIEELTRYRVFWWDTLNTTVQLGDHAAMILMRRTFLQMMREKIKEFSDVKRKATVLAIRRALEPHVLHADHIIGDVEVTGPDGQPTHFRATYKAANTGNRQGDGSTSVPRWVLKATREALAKYVENLKKSLMVVEEIDVCDDLEDLLKMTGHSFDAVAQLLLPRLMRLPENAAPLAWEPDYWARDRVMRLAFLRQRIKTHGELADADTGFVLAATAIVSLPVAVWGGTAGMVIAVAIEVADIGYSIYDSVDKYMESQAEIEFARGTLDVLGYGRLERARAEAYGGAKLAVAIGFAVLAEAGGEVFGGAIRSTLQSVRIAVRTVRINRGRRLLAQYDHDFAKVPDGLSVRQYRDMLAYVTDVNWRRALIKAAGDEQVAFLKNLRKSSEREWRKAVLDTLDDDQLKVYKRLEGLETAAAEFKARPRWAKQFDVEVYDALKPIYFRKDIRRLLKDAGPTVAAALKSDPSKAKRVLYHSLQKDREGFESAFKSRLFEDAKPRGEEAFAVTSRHNDQTKRLLLRNNWWFSYAKSDDHPGARVFTIKAGDVVEGDKIVRQFDPATGRLTLIRVGRDKVPGRIDIGLPHGPADGKGWPTLLFAQLRYMHDIAGIGYAGRNGARLREVVMNTITNARTNVELAWFRKTYFPGRSFRELNDAGLLDGFLRDTRSIQYAEPIIAMAGYRIKKIRLASVDWERELPVRMVAGGFVERGGETFGDYVKRHGLSMNSKGPPPFDIVIEVEPHRGPLGRTASVGGVRPPGGGPPRPPTPGGSDDPFRTKKFPEFDPPSDLPASVTEARRQADALYKEAEETYRRIMEGTHKLPKDEVQRAAALKKLVNMVRARNLQEGIEQLVRQAKGLNIPDEEVGRVLDRNLARLDINPMTARWDTFSHLERLVLERQGRRIIDLDESEELGQILARAQLGKPTERDLAKIDRRIRDAAARGEDFFETLRNTGTLNRLTQRTTKPLLETRFERIASDATIEELRKIARKNKLGQGKPREIPGPDVPGTPKAGMVGKPPVATEDGTVIDGPSRPAAAPTAEDLDVARNMENLRRRARAGEAGDPSAATDRLDDAQRNLDAATPAQRELAMRAAYAMRRLGIADLDAVELAARGARNPGLKTDEPSRAIASIVADAILRRGTTPITMNAFISVVGATNVAEARKAADQAARRLGYIPEKDEINPGRFRPPVR